MSRRFNILLPSNASYDEGAAQWCWRDDWSVPGQSAFMLLAKFQRLNALSASALADLFVNQKGRHSPRRDVGLLDARELEMRRIMQAFHLPLKDVASAFIMPCDLHRAMVASDLRWCPQCAAGGVHLTFFQFVDCQRCPAHGAAIRNRCPRCGEPVAYRLRPEIFRAPFNCPHCHESWGPSLAQAHGRGFIINSAYRTELSDFLCRGWYGRRPVIVQHFREAEAVAAATDWLASSSRGACSAGGANRSRVQHSRGTRFGSDCGDPLKLAQSQPQSIGRGVSGLVSCPVSSLAGVQGRIRARHVLESGSRSPHDVTLADACACYGAMRRFIMRRWGRAHRACIAAAAHHLSWRVDRSTTTMFCPVALAVLRWRMKWEGTGVPRHLADRQEHGRLGIVVWLSLYAPIGLPHWSGAADRSLVLHIFAMACLDSFHCYLAEAQHASLRARALWMPFPVLDFPEREWLFASTASESRIMQWWTAPPGYLPAGVETVTRACDASHRRQHAELLERNLPPADMPPPAIVRGVTPGRRRRSPGARATLRELSGARWRQRYWRTSRNRWWNDRRSCPAWDAGMKDAGLSPRQ